MRPFTNSSHSHCKAELMFSVHGWKTFLEEWSGSQNIPKGNASLGDASTSTGSPGVSLFLWEVPTKSCPQEVLGRDWTQAQLQFPCNKWKKKFKFSTALKSPELWMHWGSWIYWHFCSEGGSWRFWSLIFKEFMWSLEWLWALGGGWGSCEGSASKT